MGSFVYRISPALAVLTVSALSGAAQAEGPFVTLSIEGLSAPEGPSASPSVPSVMAPMAVEDTPEVTEEAIRKRWLANSPEVAAWRTQIGSARFDVVTAQLWPNPELQLLGNFLVSGAPPDGKYNYQAQVTAPLPVFGQRSARMAAAKELVGVAEMNVLATLWDRAYDIQQAMVDHAFARARASMLRHNLAELSRIRGIVALRAERGANSQYDVVRVELSAGTLEAEVMNAEVARARAEAQLLALVADPTLHTAPIGMAGLSGFRGPEDEQKLIAFALERRPDLLLAKSGARASQRSADRFRRERIPTPSLIGAGYLVEQRYGFQVTGGVSFTLPTTDLNQGLIGRALSEKRGNELLKDALETRIRHEVSGAFRARMSAKAALELFRRERLPMAKELLDRAEFSYQAGLFSIAQLFDAYQSMWEARTQELTLERQRADSEVDVERAAALWPIRSDGQ